MMPFGLSNAPATFQHFLKYVFKDTLDVFMVIYLLYILFFSRAPASKNAIFEWYCSD